MLKLLRPLYCYYDHKRVAHFRRGTGGYRLIIIWSWENAVVCKHLKAKRGHAGNGTEGTWLNGKRKKTFFPSSAYTSSSHAAERHCLWSQWLAFPNHSLISAASLYLAFTLLTVRGCCVLECALQHLAEVVLGWGAPSVRKWGAMRGERSDCCPHLSNASRDGICGKAAQLQFPPALLELPRTGLVKLFSCYPSSWLGIELHRCSLLPRLKAAAGKQCLDNSTVPWVKLAHGVETSTRAPSIMWQSWHDAVILYGYLTLGTRHSTWSYPENSHPACERGNHSLTKGSVRIIFLHCVPAAQTK